MVPCNLDVDTLGSARRETSRRSSRGIPRIGCLRFPAKRPLSRLPLPPTLPNLAPRSPEIPPLTSSSTNRSTIRPLKFSLFSSPLPLRFSVDRPFRAEDRDDLKKKESRYESFHLGPFFAANALILPIFIRIERKALERVWLASF